MKKITFLIGLLFGLFLSLSINAQTTINFNSGTALVDNTDYGSNVITVGNFKFTYNDATWFGSTLGNGNTMALEALTISTTPGQSQSITVETNDGSEFDFQSFWLDILSFTGNENWTLEGFKDGVSIGTQVISVTGNSSSGYIQIVSPNSTFDNVDKVTITAGATGFFYFDIFDDFVFGSALTNTAPTAATNTGSSLSEGGTDIVSSSELEFDDAEEPDTDITYTLDDLPDNGTLRKNTVALTLGGTFTQDDLNNNRIDYVHDGSDTTSDSFRVNVSDGQGGTIENQTFNFTIAAVDDTAPSFETSTPSYSSVTQTGFTLTTDIDEAGDIFYVVLADGATAPTSTEVVNGTGNAGAAPVTSDDVSVTTGGFSNAFSVTGLTAGTDYDVYVVARDDEGSPNLQVSPSKIDITTLANLATISTTAASSITTSSATLAGNATANGGASITERGVVYSITSTNSNPLINGTGVTKDTNGTGTGVFSESIASLSPSTQYSFKAYATNSAGTSYGTVQTFTTATPVVLATITTATQANITTTSADLGGNITNNGGAPVTERGIVWATTSNPTIANNKVSNGSSDGSFSKMIGSLPSNTTIHVRAYATNSAGTAYGSNISFTTHQLGTSNFANLGANDSGATGFKTNTSNTNYVISNIMTNAGTEMYIDDPEAGAAKTYSIKADGVNAESFSVDVLNVSSYSGAAIPEGRTFDQATNVVFKDKTGAIIRTMTLNSDKYLPPTIGSSIFSFFDNNNASPVHSVAEIIFNIVPGRPEEGAEDWTSTDITISNVVAPSVTPIITFSDIGKTYKDANFNLGATSNSAGTINYSVLAGGTGTASLSGTNNEIVTLGNAGTVTIRASQAANGIYGSSSKDITLTIGKKPLTVTAEAKSKVYGSSDPTLTYTATLEGSDVLTGSLSRAAGTDVGTYAISSTLVNSNYDITFVPANLTITKKALTITAEAKSKVYGSIDPTLTYSATLEGADVLTGSLSRAAGTDVGTYAISSSLRNSNYDITFVPANLSITKRAITITADEKSKVSGENDPEFTYQISSGSLVSGDTFSGKLTRNSGDSVGIYDILIGDLTLGGNYDLSFVSNRFNVSLVLTTGSLGRSSKAVIIEGQISSEANVIERGVVYSSTNTDPQIGGTNVIQLADTSVSGPFQMTITGLNSFTKYYFQTYIIVETPSGKIRTFTSHKSLALSELYGGAKEFTTLLEEPALALTENTNPTTGTERVDPEINLEIDFNADIQKGTGDILIKKASDDTLLETIAVSSANVIVTGQKVTITPTLELPQTTQVYVIVPVGAIEDLSGNGWTGFNDKTDWNFTSDDTVLPTIVAITPNHTSTNIAPHSNLEISFSEEIVKGTGNILVKDHLYNNTIATIDVTSAQVSVASNVVTINPTTDLPSETSFYVEIEGTAFKDSYDNNFSGVNTKDIWSFATADITAPNSPVIVEVADYTCSETTLATADNTFVITGTAENESTVNVFINDTNVGTVSTDSNGSWTLDLSSTVQIDGEYNITATATDSSNNTSSASDEFEIIVSTTNSDLDNIPDFCDSDVENDGYADATQITEKTKYGFSPNGDGINDTWTIRDIENFDNNSVKVYNRSGRLVYAKDNYDNTWDGTSSAAIGNGKLPVGAYYFTIDLKVDGVKMVSGWIYINY